MDCSRNTGAGRSGNGAGRRVVIAGGGPAGLTAAYVLSKAGIKSVVLEKGETVGGISRTVNHRCFYFDIGGHRFFTKLKAVAEIWREVLGPDLLRRKRLSRIYYRKRFFAYPLRPGNALFNLGIWNSFQVSLSFLYAQLFPFNPEETFEQWVVNRFGKRLYETFFKTYTEKVWGIPCGEIRAEWAAQRIQGLSLLIAVRNALVGSRDGGGKVRTLIEEFDYPKLGPGMMWERVADMVRDRGSEVQLGAEVLGILWSGNRVKALEVKRNGRGELITGTDFISSMPIKEVVAKFKPSIPEEVLRAGQALSYRDFVTVALIVNERQVFPDNWLYIHDPRVKVGRIQNFKNWSPYMVPDDNKTCLGLEYFCFEGDSFWSLSDSELIDLGKNELEALGLVKAGDVEDGLVVRVPKAYPIYDSVYKDALTVVRRFLRGFDNLQFVGRNGMHQYNNQDHSMLTAMLAVENIQGANHDLWKVNEGHEYLEETKDEAGPQSMVKEALAGLLLRMDRFAFAAAVGSVLALLHFLATLWLIMLGAEGIEPTLKLLEQYFFGYSVTVKGAFVGMIYSFFWGFLSGWLFAYLRNFLIAFYIYRVKRKEELLTFRDFLDHF